MTTWIIKVEDCRLLVWEPPQSWSPAEVDWRDVTPVVGMSYLARPRYGVRYECREIRERGAMFLSPTSSASIPMDALLEFFVPWWAGGSAEDDWIEVSGDRLLHRSVTDITPKPLDRYEIDGMVWMVNRVYDGKVEVFKPHKERYLIDVSLAVFPSPLRKKVSL